MCSMNFPERWIKKFLINFVEKCHKVQNRIRNIDLDDQYKRFKEFKNDDRFRQPQSNDNVEKLKIMVLEIR